MITQDNTTSVATVEREGRRIDLRVGVVLASLVALLAGLLFTSSAFAAQTDSTEEPILLVFPAQEKVVGEISTLASCYGISCEGKDPAVQGCSATTPREFTHNGWRVELRFSSGCLAAWTRITVNSASSTRCNAYALNINQVVHNGTYGTHQVVCESSYVGQQDWSDMVSLDGNGPQFARPTAGTEEVLVVPRFGARSCHWKYGVGRAGPGGQPCTSVY